MLSLKIIIVDVNCNFYKSSVIFIEVTLIVIFYRSNNNCNFYKS